MSREPSIVKRNHFKKLPLKKKKKLTKGALNTCQRSKHKTSTMATEDKSSFFEIKRLRQVNPCQCVGVTNLEL